MDLRIFTEPQQGASYDTLLAVAKATGQAGARRLPVVVGGKGASRTPKLTARYAGEFDMPFGAVEETKAQFERVREAAREIGRDPGELVYSNVLVACVGKDDAEVARRAAATGRDVAELRENGLAGTPDEVVEKIGRFAETGSSRFSPQILDLGDLDTWS